MNKTTPKILQEDYPDILLVDGKPALRYSRAWCMYVKRDLVKRRNEAPVNINGGNTHLQEFQEALEWLAYYSLDLYSSNKHKPVPVPWYRRPIGWWWMRLPTWFRVRWAGEIRTDHLADMLLLGQRYGVSYYGDEVEKSTKSKES